MSKTAHTPGPWIVTRQYVVGPRDESDSQGFGMVVGVADVYGDNRNQDANLIAAAPDLLAALQGCIAYRNWQIAEGGVVPDDLRDTFKRAESAISKAEG